MPFEVSANTKNLYMLGTYFFNQNYLLLNFMHQYSVNQPIYFIYWIKKCINMKFSVKFNLCFQHTKEGTYCAVHK